MSLRAWRLKRAETKLADLKHYHETWVEPFHRRLGTIPPSQMARERRRIEKARRRVEKLSGCAR